MIIASQVNPYFFIQSLATITNGDCKFQFGHWLYNALMLSEMSLGLRQVIS